MTTPQPPERGHVLSEQENPRSTQLGSLGVADIVALMNRENAEVLLAMERAAPALSAFLAAVEPGFVRGGRLIYLGAGSSGRLGVLDASEAPPTFCVSADRIIGIIAGGDRCLRLPSEGAEDDALGAVPELRALDLRADDALLGIAAGGTTPYVRGALHWAAALPHAPVTGLLSCAPVSAPPGCQHLIIADTGPEVLTGSTRLKAGTATKLALNTISTALMARSGRVHGNLMIDVKAANAKLVDRAARIIVRLTDVDRATALELLAEAHGSAKLAVAMRWLGCSRAEAEQRLAQVGGLLARLERAPGTPATRPEHAGV